MTLEQARKMVKGTMKGDSAMKKAIEELISGEAAPEDTTSPPPAASPDERGARTLAMIHAYDEGW